MNPAFSVIFLTTLIGVGQGLFIAMVFGQVYALLENQAVNSGSFFAGGAIYALLFLGAGLFASFFHLGHPERAWRAATRWRTSWLSREVIALPAFMFMVTVYAALHYFQYDPTLFGTAAVPHSHLTVIVGMVGMVACFVLFVCTGMIYACLKFLQEWASPLTVVNYILLGMASGYTFAAFYAKAANSPLIDYYSNWAIILTLVALVTRSASLIRNARIKHKSSLRTAIGVRHVNIQQKAQGAMGGSFNTREFFHGKSRMFIRNIKWIFLMLVFPLPVLMLLVGLNEQSALILCAAFAIQYVGLLLERWFFFAQANHPQNLYYQTI